MIMSKRPLVRRMKSTLRKCPFCEAGESHYNALKSEKLPCESILAQGSRVEVDSVIEGCVWALSKIRKTIFTEPVLPAMTSL